MELSGKKVLITGASAGIGAAAATAFAAAGATVGVCARRPDRLGETASSCAASGVPVHQWVVDLAELDGIDAFADRVIDEMGGVDVLVNNVGAGRRKRMQHITVEEFDETMNLNFGAPMRLTLRLLPHLLEKERAHIVNVGASGTREIPPRVGSYIAAKAALDAFTEALYIDLAPTNVRVHLVVPGRTATEFGVERPGQEPPFPADPRRTDSAETVADAIVACLATDDLETFPSDYVREAVEERRRDYNHYMRTRWEFFSSAEL